MGFFRRIIRNVIGTVLHGLGSFFTNIGERFHNFANRYEEQASKKFKNKTENNMLTEEEDDIPANEVPLEFQGKDRLPPLCG